MGLPDLPAPDTRAIHVHAGDETVGPMTRRELKAKLDAGDFADTDTFWFDGMEGWAEIGRYPALLDLPEPEAAPPAAASGRGADGRAETPEEDDALDAVFGDLVRQSWKYHEDHAFASHIDEVFLGAVITACLDGGWSLIDLNSDGTHHYLRFEEMEGHSRAIVRLTHLTPGLATAKVLGQRASVVVGYGERVKNFATVWKALKAEYKSGLLSGDTPGTISVDGDMNSQYVYCQVPLYLKIDDYVSRDYAVDHATLTRHFDAALHALRKYLRGRFA